MALVAIDRRAGGATYNLGEPDALTEREWILAVASSAGWQGEVVADPETAPSLPAHWEFQLVTSTRRIRDELGYREPVGESRDFAAPCSDESFIRASEPVRPPSTSFAESSEIQYIRSCWARSSICSRSNTFLARRTA